MLKNRLTYQKLLKLKNSQTGKNGKISPTNFTRLSKKASIHTNTSLFNYDKHHYLIKLS